MKPKLERQLRHEEKKGYTIIHNEPDVCYAKGSRGIPCDDHFGLWHFPLVDSAEILVICKRHYDILAKIQNKPSSEELQRKRVANTKIPDDIVEFIPNKDWWDRVLLPSYRTPW